MPDSKRKETTISFKVKSVGGSVVTPVWRKVEVENAICQACGGVMVVVVGDSMYGYCPRCQCYYIAEEGDKHERPHS